MATGDGSPSVSRHIAESHDATGRRRADEALQKAREELEDKVERKMLRRNQYRLTFRELTVLYLVADGKSDREIGARWSSAISRPRNTSRISSPKWEPALVPKRA